MIEEGIKRGCDLNIRDKNKNTPLIEASIIGNPEIVKLLVDNGADVNSQNNLGQTALYLVVKGQYTDLVKLLLEKGAAYTIATESNEYPIDVARKLGNKEIEYIISHGVFTYLEKGYIGLVKKYISEGDDINIVNSDGSTLLHECVYHDFAEIGIILIQSGADIMKKDNNGISPLMFAIVLKSNALLNEMIKKGFKCDHEELVSIAKAAQATNCNIILKYLERNDNFALLSNSNKNKQMRSDLFSAIKNRDEVLLKVLIEAGADVNEKDNDGFTPLITASTIGNENIVKYLIEKGANTNEKKKQRRMHTSY